jgi:hypothetical protein
MPKIRHLAFVCQEPKKVAEFLSKAFDLEILYCTDPPGVPVLSDGDINITLLTPSFAEHDPAAWHFGIEMSVEEIAARRPLLESLGAELNEGVRDGRPVEVYLRTPEGHRIDLAPFWPTKPGQSRRLPDQTTPDASPASVSVGAAGA